MAERRAEEAPDGVAAKTHGEQREQEMAEGLPLDRLQRALLVGDLAAVPGGQVEGKDTDDCVNQAARDEPGARQVFEQLRIDETIAR